MSDAQISGLYELCIGVDSPAALAELQSYFALFGFTESTSSKTFSTDHASELYNHASPLTSLRLRHKSSDHGLIRLWQWSATNPGAGPCALKSRGRRWGAMLTSDVFNVSYHATRAVQLDRGYRTVAWDPVRGIRKMSSENYYVVSPVSFQLYGKKEGKPFHDVLPSVHEMVLSDNYCAQVLYERHDVHLPFYGSIDENARFPCSQFNHAGLVITGDGKQLDFYSDILGLKDNFVSESSYNEATFGILDTVKGEDRVFIRSFDDPRSGDTWDTTRSGRLHTIRWQNGEGVGDVRDLSNPGCMGLSGYTYRVRDLEGYRERVLNGGGKRVSEIAKNEFEERCFGFVAPDGYWWQLIEWWD